MKLLSNLTKGAKRICFIDLESTQVEHETIAIGALLLKIDSNGELVFPAKEFKAFIKPHYRVGNVITRMTGITDEMLKDAPNFEEVIEQLRSFLEIDNDKANDLVFCCFGEQDRYMLKKSSLIAQNDNIKKFYRLFAKNYIDFSNFLALFIRDKNDHKLSLVNSLHFFDEDPHGTSHDPLNDAYDVMNLYKCFYTKKDLVIKGYLAHLAIELDIPDVYKSSVSKLLNGRNVKQSEFKKDISEYFD